MNRENPLISVIITAYNSEKFIEETIGSVLNQTYKSIEIIIVDDGSTDKTGEALKKFSEIDARIRVFSLHHSGSPAVVRNTGIADAKGEYIAFLDGDDVWEKNKLKEQVNILGKNKEAVLVYSAAVTTGVNIFSPFYEVLPLIHKAAETREDLINKGNSIPLSSVLVKKSYLVQAGGFDEDPELKIEDFDLWLRLGELGTFIFLPRIHVFYRIHQDQFSADWETKRNRLEYLARKRNLPLRDYKFRRNKNFLSALSRNLIHYLNFLLIKLITILKGS
jgi:glycosyltransferase involved in cell wall biosynthesis